MTYCCKSCLDAEMTYRREIAQARQMMGDAQLAYKKATSREAHRGPVPKGGTAPAAREDR